LRLPRDFRSAEPSTPAAKRIRADKPTLRQTREGRTDAIAGTGRDSCHCPRAHVRKTAVSKRCWLCSRALKPLSSRPSVKSVTKSREVFSRARDDRFG
jgi:hypothetical protein